MSTPLKTALFFIVQVLALLNQVDVDPLIRRYLKLVMTQLNFIQSFVDDLLDFRQLRDGVFSLTMVPFNPKKVIEMI